MIDESMFFSIGDNEAAALVKKEHLECRTERVHLMALLLTELERPEALAERINGSITQERQVLFRLTAELQRLRAAPIGRGEPTNMTIAQMRSLKTHEERSAAFFNLPRIPWPAAGEELTQTLAAIDEESRECGARLTARLADKTKGLTSRSPDSNEESDPLIRIWASRLREQADAAKDLASTTKSVSESSKRFLDMRKNEKKPKLSW